MREKRAAAAAASAVWKGLSGGSRDKERSASGTPSRPSTPAAAAPSSSSSAAKKRKVESPSVPSKPASRGRASKTVVLEEPEPAATEVKDDGKSALKALAGSSAIDTFKAALLAEMAGELPPPGGDGEECMGMEEEWSELRSTLSGSIDGEGNSILLIGRRGAGKTMLLHSVLRSLGWQSDPVSSSSQSFHYVELDARLQTTDALTLKELARQLIRSGAIEMTRETEDLLPSDEAAEQGKDDEEERAEDEDDEGAESALEDQSDESDAEDSEDEEEKMAQREQRKAEEEQRRLKREAEQAALQAAILSSLATTTTTLLAMLASPKSSAGSKPKPLLIHLASFDLFAERQTQALLYVLLDAVQSGSYAPGLCVIGSTSRVDAVEMLEKRVKSRFSGRTVQVLGPGGKGVELADVLRTALVRSGQRAGEKVDGLDKEKWGKEWDDEVDAFLDFDQVQRLISHAEEVGGDVRSLFRALYERFASIDPGAPSLRSAGSAYSAEELVDSSRSAVAQRALLDLPTPHLALLIAAKHLITTKQREVLTFAQLCAQVHAHVRRRQRDLGGGEAGITSSGLGVVGRMRESEEWASRKRLLQAFVALLELGIFIPQTSLGRPQFFGGAYRSYSTVAPVATSGRGLFKPGGASGAGRSKTSRLLGKQEWIKVRCNVDPGTVVAVVKLREASAGGSQPLPAAAGFKAWAMGNGL